MTLPTRSPFIRVGLPLLPLLLTAGVLLAAEAPAARAKVVITNPSSLDDVQFRCLLGVAPGCSTTQIEENWVVEADGRNQSFISINEWTSNTTDPTPRDRQGNFSWPYGEEVPVYVDYIKASERVVFTMNFPGGPKISQFSQLARSPAIDSLFFRVASGRNHQSFRTVLSNLYLTISPGTAGEQQIAIGNLTAEGSDSGREVRYAVLTGLPKEDFRITGGALFEGFRNDHSGRVVRDGNWQIKAAYAEVPGPLPVLGGAAAFGWSRRLRRLTRR